jgi:ribonucleoside-diphosphate reductase alpha chain
LTANDTIEGAPGLSDEHLPIFDCAFRAKNGTRTIHYMGHIRMMSAVQPFLSGAISKTVNMPHDATPDDIAEAYLQAWKMGVKALAIYRDGSKKTQPLSTSTTSEQGKETKPRPSPPRPCRPRRPRSVLSGASCPTSGRR